MEPSRETRAVFLDICKAFDKVWPEGLLFKLKCNGIGGTLLELIKNYLSGRYQRIILNGRNSSWKEITAGIPQGCSVPSFFYQGGHKPGIHGKPGKLREFEKLSESQGKLREI